MRQAIAYTMNVGASAEQLAEQHQAIERFAAERGLQIVAAFDDADPEPSDAFTKFLEARQDCEPALIVAYDTMRQREQPELWRQERCRRCNGLQTVAAVDGELIAGCELELY